MIIEDIEKMRVDLSNVDMVAFTEPQIVVFHGGCKGCTQQLRHRRGVDVCIGCQYFSANWNLPSLNNKREATAKRTRLEVLERARKASWVDRMIGCLDWVVRGGRR